MNDKRRFVIIILSVLTGTILSGGLFLLRRGGQLAAMDYTTLATNLFFSLAIVVVIGVILGRKKKN